MAACKRCARTALYKDGCCRECYVCLVEKRIRKALRHSFSSEEKTIRMFHDGSILGDVLRVVLEQVFKRGNKSLCIVKEQSKANVLPWCLEVCAVQALDELLCGKVMPKVTQPLAQIPYDDVVLLGRSKDLDIHQAVLPKQLALDVLQDAYPGSKQTLVKSLLRLH
ncbi:hypothetical protein GF342_02865 [Candidatus Woesearchaeota archaeon]|nr:hypothetical protein [Candidatus Woesearchaeota archaeon]